MMAMTRLHEVPGLCSAIDHRFGVRVVACILSRCLELHAVLRGKYRGHDLADPLLGSVLNPAFVVGPYCLRSA